MVYECDRCSRERDCGIALVFEMDLSRTEPGLLQAEVCLRRIKTCFDRDWIDKVGRADERNQRRV